MYLKLSLEISYKYTYAKTTQIQRIEKGKLKTTQGYRRWAYSSRIAFGNAVRPMSPVT